MTPTILPSSSTRLLPDEASPPHIIPLSILDCSVGNFSPTGAAWVYDGALSHDHLKVSLVKTLNAYPQWAGQLRYTKYDPNGGHTLRSRRLEISYGTQADPGVEFVVASCEAGVSELFPGLEQRLEGSGALDVSSLEALELLPKTPTLASNSKDADFTGLPCLVVQVTTFHRGGTAVALKVSHPLADAQTLLTFVNDWAAVSRALLHNLPLPAMTPVFSPSAFDQAASGDIDASSPDPQLLQIAHELPIHRYDWWATTDGLDIKQFPPHLASPSIQPGPSLPWHEWDLTLPIRNYLLYFSADEISRIWAAASSEPTLTEHRISRFDALQAHVWMALMRAHPEVADGEEFYMNLSLGMRERVSPPLGVLARACGTAQSTLATLAREIRGVLTKFTPQRVGAVLHEMAFDIDARRMWGAFLGRRNVIVTSWARIGVYELDFGCGRPRFVQPVMPVMEGIVQVMEAGPSSGGKGPWYRDGASVSVMLPVEVVQRMLEDSLLRKYQ
ncbi:transferase family-domain-containing protein [Roridomyces roridus]|uniref:Transferase family-domain-containing protein n=1 Tax=Roridomyces roridus TaxID=1738132 RepID=A0AAD7FSA4_9AGAR|nr:transferase family-domain-containing protein [Roridomyces roridus]